MAYQIHAFGLNLHDSETNSPYKNNTILNTDDIISILIVQPLIPAYRSPLFQELAAQPIFKIKVCASKTVPGIPNLTSVDDEKQYTDLAHPCKSFMGNRFLWQQHLRLDPEMKSGDVLIVSGNLRFLSNIPLIFHAKMKKVGVIWWGHGSSKQKSKLKDMINRIVMHLIDVRLLYTDTEIDNYKKQGFHSDKLFATNNAIDDKPIKKAILTWDKDRLRQFKKSEHIVNKKTLLFCGRRTDSVSLDLVYSALAQLNAEENNYIFIVIGPKEEHTALKSQAKALNIEKSVRWLGPIFNQQDLAPWFLSAACFVFPGPIGLSILHAFAYSLPVIVPDIVHNPEIAAFTDGKNGLLYKDGDDKDLREKISSITENPVFSEKLSKTARQTVEYKYNMENMVNRYIAAIQAASSHVLS